jgi:hypothetical protein
MNKRLASHLLLISCFALSASLVACTKHVPGTDSHKPSTIDSYNGHVRITWNITLDHAHPDLNILKDESEISAELVYELLLPVDGTKDPHNATYHVDVKLSGQEHEEFVHKCTGSVDDPRLETVTSKGNLLGFSQGLTLTLKTSPEKAGDATSIQITGGDGQVPLADDPLVADREDTREGCGKPRDVFHPSSLPYMTLEMLPPLTANRAGSGHWTFQGPIRDRLFEYDPNELDHWWPWALVEEYEPAKAYVDLWNLDEKCRPEYAEQDPTKEHERQNKVLSLARALAGKSRSYSDLLSSLGTQAPTPEIRPAKEKDTVDVGAWTDREGDHLVIVFPDTGVNLRDEFGTAETLAHELRHVQDDVNGFDEKAVAPLLTEDQYVALRWEAERRAFDFERKVVSELAAADGSLKSCRESYENRNWSEGDHDQWLSRHYRESDFRATWEEFKNSATNPGAKQFIHNQDISAIVDHWRPYMVGK